MKLQSIFFTEDSKEILKRWDGYLLSKEATRYQEKSDTEVEELFFAYKDADGDRESLRKLMEIVMKERLEEKKAISYAPEGYRLQAIEPDPVPLEALRKLRDSNASIPALENAAYRSDKVLYKDGRDAEYYYACADVTVDPTKKCSCLGTICWSKEEMQGFGEPFGYRDQPFYR